MNYTNILNNTITFCGTYCELLNTNVPLLFINFYAAMFLTLHLIAKCCKCIGQLYQHGTLNYIERRFLV